MDRVPETIDQLTLIALAEAGAVRGVAIIGQQGGWGVVIRYGKTERTLAAKRGSMRIFRRFETLVAYLKNMGISQFSVDASLFKPLEAPAERRRSDAAQRMKSAHDAAAYTVWLTRQVQEAIDDPRPSVSHEEVVAEWEIERAAFVRLASSKGE